MLANSRRHIRYRCRIKAQLLIRDRGHPAFILDVSEAGVRVMMHRVPDVLVGEKIMIESPDLGLIAGYIRWRKLDCLGIKLEQSTNTTAKVQAFRKLLRLEPAA